MFSTYRGYQILQSSIGYDVIASGSTVHTATDASAARNWIDTARTLSRLNEALDDLASVTR